jgi:hypothetical protein
MCPSNRRPRAVHRTRRFGRVLFTLAGSIALSSIGFAPGPVRAQSLELVGPTPLERFPVRFDDGEWVDPYAAAFAPAGKNGYYALRFELSFDEPGPGQLLGQRFDGADLPIGTPRAIGTAAGPSSAFQRGIQVQRRGDRMLAIWQRHTGSPNVFGRFLNPRGGPLSGVVSLGFTVSGSPAIALLESGRALVVGQDNVSAGGRLVGRTIEPGGLLGPQLFLADGDARTPALGADAQNRFLVVWKDFRFESAPHFDLRGLWLDSDGSPTGASFLITRKATGPPALALWPDGRSAVAWSTCSDTFGQEGCELRLRRLDDEGQPIGARIRLSPEDGLSHLEPTLAIGKDGVLLVSWQACPPIFVNNNFICHFHAVAFDPEGELLATAPVLEIVGEPVRRKVVALEDDFLVSWYGFSASPEGIYTQRYRLVPASDEEPPPEDPPEDPPPPAGAAPLSSPEFPDFRFWVRISAPGGPIDGTMEAACIPETICVSGALPGRSEVFLRVVGPRPNGFLWPTLVKFTTSTVEVWIEQVSTGTVRYYLLEGASPGSSELPGLFDRHGFQP